MACSGPCMLVSEDGRQAVLFSSLFLAFEQSVLAVGMLRPVAPHGNSPFLGYHHSHTSRVATILQSEKISFSHSPPSSAFILPLEVKMSSTIRMSTLMPPPPPPPQPQNERVYPLKSLFNGPQPPGLPFEKSRKATQPASKLYTFPNLPNHQSPRVKKHNANHSANDSRKRKSRGAKPNLLQQFQGHITLRILRPPLLLALS